MNKADVIFIHDTLESVLEEQTLTGELGEDVMELVGDALKVAATELIRIDEE